MELVDTDRCVDKLLANRPSLPLIFFEPLVNYMHSRWVYLLIWDKSPIVSLLTYILYLSWWTQEITAQICRSLTTTLANIIHNTPCCYYCSFHVAYYLNLLLTLVRSYFRADCLVLMTGS